jgi:hypothetical protein
MPLTDYFNFSLHMYSLKTQIDGQTAVPTRAPIPAVIAIANAPQKVTRTVALSILAPPALAPMAPSTARNNKEEIATA